MLERWVSLRSTYPTGRAYNHLVKHTYGPYDGKPFLGPDELFPSPQLIEFILQYGDQAMEALQNLDDPEEQELHHVSWPKRGDSLKCLDV